MDGDQGIPGITELVEQHYQLLYRYASRLSGRAADAEDLTQQTFLIAHQKLEQLRNPDHARSWLCAILRNLYLKRLRQEGGRSTVPLEVVPEPVQELPETIEINPAELQATLNELPEDFRTPLILFYFEQFSYKDIARQMDVPIGTIMSRLSRAKSFLRSRLLAPEVVSPDPHGD